MALQTNWGEESWGKFALPRLESDIGNFPGCGDESRTYADGEILCHLTGRGDHMKAGPSNLTVAGDVDPIMTDNGPLLDKRVK
jgi:hypothetical protein